MAAEALEGGERRPRRAPAPKIPGYRLEGVIGRGATGVVYRAVQLAVERPVALKVLHPELVGTRAVRRLQREARTTARLTHPGIVSAIDMGEVGGLWWYAMELVDGRSLAEILEERGALTQRQALRLFIPLCEALQHAFENGVVHRDVKPGNILITKLRRARLVDLGLAFTEEDPRLTRTGGTLGTPYYISPEQARDPGTADVRSDIWSLGATMYHAVCGRPPFEGSSVAEILSSVLYASVIDPRTLQPSLSKGFALVLRKCLNRDPDGRYQEPRDLLEDLELLVERRPVRVEAKDLDPLRGERRWALPSALAAAVAVALGLGWWFTLGPGGQAVDEAAPGPVEVAAYAPLEELAGRIADEAAPPGALLAELDRIDAEVPPRVRERLAEVRAQGHRAYNRALAELRRRVQRELDDKVDGRRDLVAAQAYLDVELERALRDELKLGEERVQEVLASEWVRADRARVAASLAAAVENLRTALNSYFDDVVVERVDSLQRRYAWKSARAELAREPAEWLAELGLEVGGLPPAEREEVLVELRERAATRARALESDWARVDAELADFLTAERRRLTRLLERREAPEDVGVSLAQSFAGRLDELGLSEDEALREVAEAAWSALAVMGPGLTGLQKELFVADAEAWFGLQAEDLRPAYARRDYRGAAASWRAGAQLGWPEPVAGRVALRVQEADLLEDLLLRAARGVQVRDGREESFFVGSIAATGTVTAGDDPLDVGFQLQSGAAAADAPGRGAHRLRLRARDEAERAELVLAADLERITGLPADAAALTQGDRLARAAFRFREGDARGAAECLAAGVLPDGELALLAADLSRRIADVNRGLARETGARLAEAERLYNLVKRETLRGHSHVGDVQDAVAKIEVLLHDYLDLPWVREREAELRRLRRELAPPATGPAPADLQRMYAPDEVEELPGGRAILRYALGAAESGGTWSRGDWRFDGVGWSAPALRTRTDLALDTRWPRLVLGPPLDISSGVLDATFTIEQLEDSGPPRLLLLTVAGIHLALAGAEETREPRWSIASGRTGLEELIATVPDGAGAGFAGLARGARHVVRIELRRGRGRVRVLVDGEELAARTIAPPAPGEAGSASLVVRSLEPLRLLAVEIEAAVQ